MSRFKIDFGEHWLRNGLIGAGLFIAWYIISFVVALFLKGTIISDFVAYVSQLQFVAIQFCFDILREFNRTNEHDWFTYLLLGFTLTLFTGFVLGVAVLPLVKFFCKLPRWFVVPTPLGDYNPDWAVVTERDQKLYLVRETKSTHDRDKRRSIENKKVDCGKAHFTTLGIDFKVATDIREVLEG